jgi:hypothetical protein
VVGILIENPSRLLLHILSTAVVSLGMTVLSLFSCAKVLLPVDANESPFRGCEAN